MESAFGIIVIGDEILNGRRRDRHFESLGGLLRARGFKVAWLRILPDDSDYLVAELRRTMAEAIPVFCCGGIGATPDDVTRDCAARAAGVPLERHAGAVAEIEAQFGAEAYPIRVRMAELPRGCDLIPNPHSRIPGFSLQQHFFMPGFPAMAQPMAQWVLDTHFAEGGRAEHEVAIRVKGVAESSLVDLMQELSARFPGCKLFSLPRLSPEPLIELGFRGRDDLQGPIEALIKGLTARGIRYERVD